MEQRQVARPGLEHVRGVLSAHNAPDLLYGAIVAGSVLAVSSAHADATSHVVVATGVVTAIYWLAHVYVDAVGGRFTDRDGSIHLRIGEAMRNGMEVLAGAVPPIAVFALSRILGADVQTSAQIALWFTAALLVVAGFGAAFLAGVRGWPLVLESAIAGGFGLLVVLLKYLLH